MIPRDLETRYTKADLGPVQGWLGSKTRKWLLEEGKSAFLHYGQGDLPWGLLGTSVVRTPTSLPSYGLGISRLLFSPAWL